MLAGVKSRGLTAPTAAGFGVGLAGVVFTLAGLWARREVGHALAEERILDPQRAGSTDQLVTTGAAARSMAEFIRKNTLAATSGRTYAETDAYVDEGGTPTSDVERAVRDERTGTPIEHPDHALWIQSTTLQTALMQAYVASRLAELTVALGASFVAVGIGLAAAGRRSGCGVAPTRRDRQS